jgi:hypothetical protein
MPRVHTAKHNVQYNNHTTRGERAHTQRMHAHHIGATYTHTHTQRRSLRELAVTQDNSANNTTA